MIYSNSNSNETYSLGFYINEFLENIWFSDEEVNKEIIEIENYVKSNDVFDNTKDVNQNTSELSVVPLFRQIIDYNSFNDLETNRLCKLDLMCNVYQKNS